MLNTNMREIKEMNKNLLIVGAGIYGVVAKEIAESMNCFEKIAFVDDNKKETANGTPIIGTTTAIGDLVCEYNNVFVAIGNPEARLSLMRKLEEETSCRIVTLVSPKAYIAPSAQIMKGSIIEPMAVVHTGAVISAGCIISAGAVVNHASMCCDGVHVDCNATVVGCTLVPAGMKIKSGGLYERKTIEKTDLFFNPDEWAKKLSKMTNSHMPTPTDNKTNNIDDVE